MSSQASEAWTIVGSPLLLLRIITGHVESRIPTTLLAAAQQPNQGQFYISGLNIWNPIPIRAAVWRFAELSHELTAVATLGFHA